MLEKELNEIQKNISNVKEVDNKTPYYLHAIMNHEGIADSGHYYSFIYDRKAKIWYKFNDHKV
jgi:ubiquitin carboxyl-terminal hydrolase 25